jgi:hypothetical protein
MVHHHKRAVKKNAAKRQKGEANKWDRNIIPNDYWVTVMLPFIDPHVAHGKINVTLNRGQHAPRNYDQHESRKKNMKQKDDVVRKAAEAAKKKDKNSPSRRKRGTISSPLTELAGRRNFRRIRKRERVSILIKNCLRRRTWT